MYKLHFYLLFWMLCYETGVDVSQQTNRVGQIIDGRVTRSQSYGGSDRWHGGAIDNWRRGQQNMINSHNDYRTRCNPTNGRKKRGIRFRMRGFGGRRRFSSRSSRRSGGGWFFSRRRSNTRRNTRYTTRRNTRRYRRPGCWISETRKSISDLYLISLFRL